VLSRNGHSNNPISYVVTILKDRWSEGKNGKSEEQTMNKDTR
jgi:hypothetical protein